MSFKRRGLLLVLSSPSGAGKTTLAHNLLTNDNDIVPSISVTTRKARINEIDGRDYYFIDEKKFQTMIKKGELLEHAIVHENGYGTPKKFVEEQIEEGKDIIFDIDWQGAQQLRQRIISDLVTVFILPPSCDELQKRLSGRATDIKEVVQKRLKKAASEISHWAEYDYVLINDNPEYCTMQLRSILEAERLKRRRQIGLVKFIQTMTNEMAERF